MASQTRSASPSRELFGFEVHERLGQGAASDIYLASDPATGQVYALKHVVRSEDCQTRILEQLAVEYDVSRRFTHPGLRRSYQLKERRTMLRKVMEAALVMELVDGIGLDVHPQLPPAQLLDCLIQTANALAAMHALGYVHCDLKPNNLLLQPDGQIKVIDFGQACRIRTVKERIQGTADFIAPEQVRRQPITVRTDVYNFECDGLPPPDGQERADAVHGEAEWRQFPGAGTDSAARGTQARSARLALNVGDGMRAHAAPRTPLGDE